MSSYFTCLSIAVPQKVFKFLATYNLTRFTCSFLAEISAKKASDFSHMDC